MSETIGPETGTKRKIKFTYVISAIAISCLMIGTAFGMMISATTPTGFPTVIEPGSNAIGASYVVFKDGSNYYARNGTTGRIDSSSATALTIIEYAMDHSPLSGIIAIGPGNFAWSGANYLLIDKPGITFQGSAPHWIYSVDPVAANPTILGGNITIVSENVIMERLGIGGALTLSSVGNPVTSSAHWLKFIDISVSDGIKFIGIDGAGDAWVPLIIEFEGGMVSKSTTGPILDFDNEGASIDHILFSGMVLLQMLASQDVVAMHGYVGNINWVNCMFFMDATAGTVLNLTLPGIYPGEYSKFNPIGFSGCYFEFNYANSTIVSIADYLYTTPIDIQFIGGAIIANLLNSPIIVNDYSGTTGGTANLYTHNKRILFNTVTFGDHTLSGSCSLKFKSFGGTANSDDTLPKVLPVFINCLFGNAVTITQLGHLGSVGKFENNYNLNPMGKTSFPFHRSYWMNSAHGAIAITPNSDDNRATPENGQNYTARDLDYLITSIGGTVSDITIWDQNGVVVLTGATTLSHYYLPWGYAITWTYSGAPTVTVEGL